MTFCANCGEPVEGSFCGKCGTPATGSGPAGAAAGIPENVAGALCYLPYLLGFLIAILFLLLPPYNQKRTVRFHAFQAILLTAAFIFLYFFIGVAFPWWALSLSVSRMFMLGSLGLWIYMMWATFNNNKIVLPVIGPVAEKQV